MGLSEDTVVESVLSFYHMGHRDWTQVVTFVGNCLYKLKHFISAPKIALSIKF